MQVELKAIYWKVVGIIMGLALFLVVYAILNWIWPDGWTPP